jgi:hypothetical protein
MTDAETHFQSRLDAILPKLRSNDFLRSRGLGNEIAFYVFDYPPQYELKMRQHVDFVVEKLTKDKIRVQHVNLFDMLMTHLEREIGLEDIFEKQRLEGNAQLLADLEGIRKESALADVFVEQANDENADVILVSGVGSAYPLVRTHMLLNSLHAKISTTPVVFFYPGTYDGKSFHLFGRLASDSNQRDPYYRAFKLVA